MNYSEKLRALAEYLDDRPELRDRLSDDFEYPSFSVYFDDFEEFQETIKTLGGFEKSGAYGNLSATHTQTLEKGWGRVFRIYLYVSGVCERVEKVDDDGKPVMQKKSSYVETDELEPVYEWKCPESWLS